MSACSNRRRVFSLRNGNLRPRISARLQKIFKFFSKFFGAKIDGLHEMGADFLKLYKKSVDSAGIWGFWGFWGDFFVNFSKKKFSNLIKKN